MADTSGPEFKVILQQVLDEFNEETFEDSLLKLRFFFAETLLLAALDLVDRDSVIMYRTPWGRPQFEVLGSTATYVVFPGAGLSRAYCTCPAYAYSVLLSETQIMCKHVLATLLAQRLSRCVERPMNADELVGLIEKQCYIPG
ncbi:uncharacterized protein BXZ73DRAFT_97885 [Epithele typhae]|uniref:uncharacterized protein n=1 Tax=Epithele typhae TaxID=378194 RepID=UPI002007DA88|nr:uncharacterized protein BXZ73DRAFT_97885 [Epithele typhae]KAH9942476.1 hypothetical protein BXZ73DRAFT_97885 [Epithele typhae]